MAGVATVVLLAAALAGLVAFHRVGYAVPALLAGVALGAGLLSPTQAGHAITPLAAPLAFVLLAVPLAVLLDRLGLFAELARRISATGHVLGACWVLAAVVTALLNLDAAVVMLTPLYFRLAGERSLAAIVLCIQPLLLSCLASSALPISNLTNLVAEHSAGLSTLGFVEHLGLPTLAASAIGWLAYLRLLRSGRLGATGAPGDDDPPALASPRPRRRTLLIAGAVVCACVGGFLVAPSFGAEPWEVAAGGDVVLVALARTVPWRTIPWQSIATVLGLGVLAAALAAHLPVDSLLGGNTVPGVARTAGVLALGGNAANNLPALLIALPRLGPGSWRAWAALLGDNIGPLALPTGTLASLLWLETLRRLGVGFSDRDYLRVAWRVALPALVAGLGALLALGVVSDLRL